MRTMMKSVVFNMFTQNLPMSVTVLIVNKSGISDSFGYKDH